jgi:hypothetical protein
MRNTKTKIKKTPLDSYPAFPHRADSPFTCHRCQGLFVRTFCLDMYDGTEENGFWALRCLQCGELFDPVILRNRTANPQSILTGHSRQQFPLSLQ